MCEEGAKEELCETCLERGRVRKADVVNEYLQLCRDCFGGKPFCRDEIIGDSGDDGRRARQRRYYQLPGQREKRRECARKWREKNRERVRAYWRNWKRTQMLSQGESGEK